MHQLTEQLPAGKLNKHQIDFKLFYDKQSHLMAQLSGCVQIFPLIISQSQYDRVTGMETVSGTRCCVCAVVLRDSKTQTLGWNI